MLTNFFSNTKPVNSIILITLFFCYVIIGFFTGYTETIGLGLFIWFFILFGVVNFITSRNNLTFDNSYFFLFFIMLFGYFPNTITIDSFFYSNLVLTLYVRRVYSLQSSKNSLKKLFDSGLWIGISFLIEPVSVIFFSMTYFSVTLHQHIDYKRLFAPIFGFIAPIILSFTYNFWYDQQDNFYRLFQWNLQYDISLYDSFSYKFSIGIILLLTIIGLFLKTPRTLAIKNTFRKSWMLLIFHFFLSCVLILIVPDKNGIELLYLFFPVAVIIANGFELFQKKWFADIILLLLFLGGIVSYII